MSVSYKSDYFRSQVNTWNVNARDTKYSRSELESLRSYFLCPIDAFLNPASRPLVPSARNVHHTAIHHPCALLLPARSIGQPLAPPPRAAGTIELNSVRVASKVMRRQGAPVRVGTSDGSSHWIWLAACAASAFLLTLGAVTALNSPDLRLHVRRTQQVTSTCRLCAPPCDRNLCLIVYRNMTDFSHRANSLHHYLQSFSALPRNVTGLQQQLDQVRGGRLTPHSGRSNASHINS